MDTPADHVAPGLEEPVRRAELVISYTLRIGVFASLMMILLGMGVSFLRHPQYARDPRLLAHLTTPGSAFPHTLREIAFGLEHVRGQSIVLLGMLLLISTPVVRVAISIFVFVRQKDAAFVAITSTVLLLLLLSFLIGHVTE